MSDSNQYFPLENLVGPKTNRLKVYQPDDTPAIPSYVTNFPILSDVDGPHPPTIFKLKYKTPLPVSKTLRFDACADNPLFRPNSYRGRRRVHAFQLAAKYREKPIYQWTKWFTEAETSRLGSIFLLLQIFCQGIGSHYADKESHWFQVNDEVHQEIETELENIR